MNSSNTALHLAGLNGCTCEISGCSDIAWACSNTFHHACYSGHSDVVEKLASECGYDVNASNCSMVKRMLELRFKTSNHHNYNIGFLGHNMLRTQQINHLFYMEI